MARAIWRDWVLAECEDTKVVEGTHSFPPGSAHREHLIPSDRHTECPWKGVASCFDVTVDGEVNPGAPWHHPRPTTRASDIAGDAALGKGVQVHDGPAGRRSRFLAGLLGR